MKFTLGIIALGVAGFAAGYFTRESPAQPAGSPSKAKSARLDSVLRSGDSAHALESLRKLAEEDPRAFFKELGHFPRLDGIEELVSLAASKLAAGDPADSAKLLNQIPNVRFRDAAWIAYVKGLEGRSLLEKLDIARLAQPVGEKIGLIAVLGPAMKADPDGTLELLRRRETVGSYRSALGNFGKTRPDLVFDKLTADMKSGLLKPSDGQWILSTMTTQSQSPEVLGAAAKTLKDHGWGEGLYAGPIFTSAFDEAGPADKAVVVDAIDTLSAVQKNSVLSQIPLASCPDASLALRILNSMDSTELQVSALKGLKQSGAEPGMVAAVFAGIASERTRELMKASDP
ncbi:hypothetical protein [Haloferula sp. BvORR071]|uniref:hypothetical protein n=1 Tax=Haloferula sp. BvORR071 TaxID=1396141 RepID=UPI0005536DBF|nr:hypothetical protein [Haloferula sp. BvORR071]